MSKPEAAAGPKSGPKKGPRKGREMYTHIAWLNAALTAIFVLELVWITAMLWPRGDVPLMLGLGAAVSAVATVTVALFKLAGTMMSEAVVKHGFADGPPPLLSKGTMAKWTAQSWQLFFHVGMSILEYQLLTEEPWYTDPRTSFVPCPAQQDTKYGLKVLYLTQLAVWCYTCFVHRFVDVRRKDYYVMYIHHVITIALVTGSAAAGYYRFGILVLYIHDISDVVVDLLKMVNFLKLEGPRGFFLSEALYVLCTITWFYWRLYVFPFRIVMSAMYDYHRECSDAFPGEPFRHPMPAGMPGYFQMTILLWILAGLHYYWFALLVRIGLRMTVLKESGHAVATDEYEGESDSEEEGPKIPAVAAAAGSSVKNVAAKKRT